MQVSVVPTAAICWEAPDPSVTVGAFVLLPEPSGTPLNAKDVTLALLLPPALLLLLPLLPLLLLLLLLLPPPLALLLKAPVMKFAVGFC